MDISETARAKARDFIDNEKQFQLGFLPTEQSFNTDRLDEREKEIANVFEAMREARKKFARGKGAR